MATILLPPDFKEFLQLLNDHDAKYLLIGGYAVGYYGYPRTTGDMDIFIAHGQPNASRIVAVAELGSISVNVISLEDLKVNKAASGRLKDLNDLQHLP
ncbi:MAG: hypothetical protein V4671_29040 [Armatimonadota bacterium]